MAEQASKRGAMEEFREEFVRCWQQLPNKGLFFGLLAVWLALFHFLGNATLGYMHQPSLLGWMYYTYNSGTGDDAHGMLIPFAVAFVFWWKRNELLALPMRVWWPGLAIVAAAAVLHIVGYLVQQPRISIVALFVGIYGLMGLAWGWQWLRASFLPFCLFAFCIPIASLGGPVDAVSFRLRYVATAIVAAISKYGLGIDIIREGMQLFDEQRTFQYEVAAACGGMRSLTATLALASIFAILFYSVLWKRLAIVAAAIPLALIGNVCRLMMIVLAAEVFGQSAGNYVHENSFFSLIPYVPAILGLLLVGRWLEDRKHERDAVVPATGVAV